MTQGQNKLNKKLCLVLLLLSFILLGGCSRKQVYDINVTKNVASQNIIDMSETDGTYHYVTDSTDFIAADRESDHIALLIDKRTNSFAITEKSKNVIWSALPLKSELTEADKEQTRAAVARISVLAGTDKYVLNTQDNSVAFSKSSYALTKTGALFTYDIFPDEATSVKKTYGANDIGWRLLVEVNLVDGSANVNVRSENLTGNKNSEIEKIELLNYFGAYNDMTPGDYLLVPDGSGALIDTSAYDDAFEEISLPVCGNDPAKFSDTGNVRATLPAFGIRHGSSAFVAVVEKGYSCATILADKAKNFSDYNRAFATFELTPSVLEGDTLYVAKTPATDEISLCLRFLSGRNADYSGMASACRETLIRSGLISSDALQETNYQPLFLTLQGCKTQKIGPFEFSRKVTGFEQAEDMLIRMKNKGINNVFIRYTDVFSSSSKPDDLSGGGIKHCLGGRKKFNELYEYVSSQNMKLFLNCDILLTDNSNNDKIAGGITGRNVEFEGFFLKNYFADEKNVLNILTATKHLDFSGFCFDDIGLLHYTDYKQNGIHTESAESSVSASLRPLSTGKSIMVNAGNDLVIGNVSAIINLPMTTTLPESGVYRPIPFLQLVLHGVADYAGSAANEKSDSTETLLKAVEYGASVHYCWNYASDSTNSENDIYYYENTVNDAAALYGRLNEVLNDLRCARMSNHTEISNGIFCTEYDTGAQIYTNYTDSEFTVMGIVIPPRNFVRVN